MEPFAIVGSLSKSKRGKAVYFDTVDFANDRKEILNLWINGHALILAQKGICKELHLVFVNQMEQDNIGHI